MTVDKGFNSRESIQAELEEWSQTARWIVTEINQMNRLQELSSFDLQKIELIKKNCTKILEGVRQVKGLADQIEASPAMGGARLATVMYPRLIMEKIGKVESLKGPGRLAAVFPGLFQIINGQLEKVSKFGLSFYEDFYVEEKIKNPINEQQRQGIFGKLKKMIFPEATGKNKPQTSGSREDALAERYLKQYQAVDQLRGAATAKNELRADPTLFDDPELMEKLQAAFFPPQNAVLRVDPAGKLEAQATIACRLMAERLNNIERTLRYIKDSI